MELIHKAGEAYRTLSDLRESGYTIDELVDMLPLLEIGLEVLEEISKW